MLVMLLLRRLFTGENMHRFKCFVLFICLMLLAMPASAIGEVTPTPAPEVEEAVTDEIDVDALIAEGLEEIQAGEFRSALAKMDIVIEADPGNTGAYYIRGVAGSQLGFLDNAIEDFTSGIDLSPWRFDLYLLRGDVHLANGSTIEALLDYDEVVRLSPFSPDGYLRRSDIHYESGEDAAGDVDDLIARAMSARANGQLAESIAFLDEALAISEEVESAGVAYYLRGIVNLALGDTDAAFEDYATSLEIDPDLHNAYLARGILYSQQGNIKAAGRDFYNRIQSLGTETIELEMAIGDELIVEMAYRRVIEVSFDAEAGQIVTISVRDTGETVADPLIALLDPDGEAIAGDDDSGARLGSRLSDFEIPANGTYTLVISHAEGGRSSGFNGQLEVEIRE